MAGPVHRAPPRAIRLAAHGGQPCAPPRVRAAAAPHLLVIAGARDAHDSFGNYEMFVAGLFDVAEIFEDVLTGARVVYDDNGGDADDADHSGVLLEPFVPPGLAVLVPLRPPADTVAGVALTVSERLHAFAAPMAMVAAFLILILIIVVFHHSFETAFAVGLTVMSHFYVHTANGHGGENYDYNQSLYDMAFAPPNVFTEARLGNPLAVGVITSFVMLLGYQRDRCLRGFLHLWRRISRMTNEGTVFLVLCSS